MGDVSILNSFPFHLQSDHANWILWYLQYFNGQRTRRNENKNAKLRFHLTLSLKSKLQDPPPPYTHARTRTHNTHTHPGQTSGIWLLSVLGEWEVWLVGPSRGWGIWPLPWWVWTAIKCQVFSRAPKWLTAINTWLDKMEKFKGRKIALN